MVFELHAFVDGRVPLFVVVGGGTSGVFVRMAVGGGRFEGAEAWQTGECAFSRVFVD